MVFVSEAGVPALRIKRRDIMKGCNAINGLGREEAHAVDADAQSGTRGELSLPKHGDLGGSLRILR